MTFHAEILVKFVFDYLKYHKLLFYNLIVIKSNFMDKIFFCLDIQYSENFIIVIFLPIKKISF